MQLRWITATGVSEHQVDAAADLLAGSDGLVWLGRRPDPAAARIEVDALARRLESDRLRPQHAYDLTYAIVTAVAKRLREFTAD